MTQISTLDSFTILLSSYSICKTNRLIRLTVFLVRMTNNRTMHILMKQILSNFSVHFGPIFGPFLSNLCPGLKQYRYKEIIFFSDGTFQKVSFVGKISKTVRNLLFILIH